jgi:hypothetical protein
VQCLATWRVVHPDELMKAYPYGPDHPDTWFRMNYLITLGSTGGTGATEPKKIVSGIRHQGELSAEQIQAAEQWAQETYERYFAATPYDEKIASGPLCAEN